MAAEAIQLNAWRGRLQVGAKGERKTLYNLMLYLQNLPGLGATIRFNELAGIVEWKGEPLRDADYVDIQILVEKAGFQPNKTDIPAAVARLAFDHAYHPVRQYLDNLKWDGINRLDRFLPILFGTRDTAYERAIGARWMIGAVARVYQPGCKMDTMLVLEGPQGLKKSTALRTLFGAQFFTEMVNELRDHKRFVEQIAGKWVVEFAELSALRKADVEMVKAIITMQIDKTRPSYGRHTVEYPRQCVLAASVNPKAGQGYLTDRTGNRRFWPVACTAIDLAKIERKRDLLWAEALVRYRDGEQWWLTDEENALAVGEQDARMQRDAWEETIAAHLTPGFTYTSTQLLVEAIKMPLDRLDQRAKERIAEIMTDLGWDQAWGKERQADGSRKSARVWRLPS
ncbi:VapE domain-containing protein [Sphingomonas sp.]|uniref:VapE domain-containing protein n=1 Tax=Sphingomonas sp. TaxID=28214 RepID=UPI0035C868AE